MSQTLASVGTPDMSSYVDVDLFPGPQNKHQGKDGKDDPFDTDLEQEEETQSSYDISGQELYLSICKRLGIVPATYFVRHMMDSSLDMKHHGLGALGVKAMCIPLQNNTRVTSLDLEDNWLEGEGGEFVSIMLKENCFISELNLANNKLGSRGGAAMSLVLSGNTSVEVLNMSGNDFSDKDAPMFAEMITENNRLKTLDLSHNRFNGQASKLIGGAIAENESIEELNLSWNEFRRSNAKDICDGLKTNSRLRVVTVAFNGFGGEGAIAAADVIKNNNVIQELDLGMNRIMAAGAVAIGRALEHNETLKILKIGHNPFGVEGVNALLKGVSGDNSGIELLDMSGIDVDKEFAAAEKALTESKKIVIKRGYLMGDYVIKGSAKKKGKIFGVNMDEITAENLFEYLLVNAQEQGNDFVEHLYNLGSEKVNKTDLLNIIKESGMAPEADQQTFLESMLQKISNSAGLIDVSKYI